MKVSILVVSAICVATAGGQNPVTPRPLRRIGVVTGAPYSADQLQTYTRTLPDGASNINSNVISHYARDSQGRMRAEEALKSAASAWRIEIFDPVAHVAYVLDDQAKTATR